MENDELPSPRLIGNKVMQHSVYNPAPKTVMNYGSLLMGQYLTHDSGLRNPYQNGKIKVCTYILLFFLIFFFLET